MGAVLRRAAGEFLLLRLPWVGARAATLASFGGDGPSSKHEGWGSFPQNPKI